MQQDLNKALIWHKKKMLHVSLANDNKNFARHIYVTLNDAVISVVDLDFSTPRSWTRG